MGNDAAVGAVLEIQEGIGVKISSQRTRTPPCTRTGTVKTHSLLFLDVFARNGSRTVDIFDPDMPMDQF